MKFFYSLSEVVDKFGLDIEFIISEWIKGKFYIFIHFDGEPCTLRHCRENKDDFEYDVRNGMDLFQHESNPLHEYLSFTPEQNLEKHFQWKFKHEWSIRFFKGYNEYRYDGMAYGYWHIKPTKTTHFSREQYVLSDKEKYNDLKNKAGVVFVSPFHNADYDYLVFRKSLTSEIKNLYIEREAIESFYNDLISEPTIKNVDGSINFSEEYEDVIVSYYPPNSRFALYILINEIFSRNGKVPPGKVAWFFQKKGIPINPSTVKVWMDNPPVERNVQFREKTRDSEMIYILLHEHFKDKKFLRNPSAVTEVLTEIAQSNTYNFDVNFTCEDVCKWLKLNKK